MTEKGISMQAIKVAPNRPVHFTGFFTLGADKPFIMVENLDTYDEIVKICQDLGIDPAEYLIEKAGPQA